MRTLIIGDIHHRVKEAEHAIASIPHDKVVCTGDYFDQFFDGRGKSRRTAKWLKAFLCDPNNILLYGNHDVPYFKSKAFSCPGWTVEKDRIINYVMKESDWHKLKWHTWVDGFLISHAGVHPSYVPRDLSLDSLQQWFAEQDEGAWQAACDPVMHHHWYWDRGPARSGFYPVGGLLWLDWNHEFVPTYFNQIVGHTPDSTTPIRRMEGYSSVNYCVDGLWGGVLVIEDGKPEIWTKLLTNDGTFVKVE
jgi:hypothetical protein